MKTVNALSLAAVGLVGSAHAFSLDFSAFANGLELDNSIVVPVPGYGNVRFTESPTPPTSLEITDQFAPFTGINFVDGETVFVTFEGGAVRNVDFAFAGVGAGESFTATALNSPDNGSRSVTFSGTGAALIAANFDAVPEPSSTLLVALSALGLVARRRR